MKIQVVALIVAMLFSVNAMAQLKKPLPRNINIPSQNHISPSLSGDGSKLTFFSNYSSSGKMALKYTFVDNGQWKEPEELSINRIEDDFVGGQFLAYDGAEILLTSKRVPGIGKFDIWFSEKQGSYWKPAQNIGKPINSSGNEGHASLSPDGKYLFFMRCAEMDIYNCNDCDLYMAERKTGIYWNEPEKLPYPINTGDEATPRIMPDGETLVFASKRAGGKGGYDLYLSRKSENGWSQPEALDYLNTEQDDQYVSFPAHGNIAYFSNLFNGNFSIMMAKVPDHLKPKKVVMIKGVLKDATSGAPLEGAAQVYDAQNKTLDQFIKIEDKGKFFVMIKGDGIYDFSVITRKNNHLYHANLYDLHHLQQSLIEEINLELEPARTGEKMILNAIQFEPYSAIITPESEIAFKRLIKFMKDNRALKMEIGVHIEEVVRDTIRSSPNLTEVDIDTIYQMPFFPELTVLEHSLHKDSLALDSDSTQLNLEMVEVDTLFLLDSLKQVYLDSMYNEHGFMYNPDMDMLFKLNYTYHNDRTPAQAEAIRQKLLDMGVPESVINVKPYGDDQPAFSTFSEESSKKNQRVELIIL